MSSREHHHDEAAHHLEHKVGVPKGLIQSTHCDIKYHKAVFFSFQNHKEVIKC